jgi:hypothetical protein
MLHLRRTSEALDTKPGRVVSSLGPRFFIVMWSSMARVHSAGNFDRYFLLGLECVITIRFLVVALIDKINPLSPPAAPVQGRLQGPPAKSKFLAVN